ncbi:DUF6479 family protein [Embleya sp. NPDC127516]|uniref:DUF6479 family protein n=1 Tax=Embleya sp. NPDC127516 TaxID=3363990 RepID=UPI00380B0384
MIALARLESASAGTVAAVAIPAALLVAVLLIIPVVSGVRRRRRPPPAPPQGIPTTASEAPTEGGRRESAEMPRDGHRRGPHDMPGFGNLGSRAADPHREDRDGIRRDHPAWCGSAVNTTFVDNARGQQGRWVAAQPIGGPLPLVVNREPKGRPR